METKQCEKCGFDIMTITDGVTKWIDDEAGVSTISELELCGECIRDEIEYATEGEW